MWQIPHSRGQRGSHINTKRQNLWTPSLFIHLLLRYLWGSQILATAYHPNSSFLFYLFIFLIFNFLMRLKKICKNVQTFFYLPLDIS